MHQLYFLYIYTTKYIYFTLYSNWLVFGFFSLFPFVATVNVKCWNKTEHFSQNISLPRLWRWNWWNADRMVKIPHKRVCVCVRGEFLRVSINSGNFVSFVIILCCWLYYFYFSSLVPWQLPPPRLIHSFITQQRWSQERWEYGNFAET